MTEWSGPGRRYLHGVAATHLRSGPVHEKFRGETVWEGVGEVFAVEGHHRAELACAWSHETDDGGQRYIAILGVPPIDSARDALRASIAAETTS